MCGFVHPAWQFVVELGIEDTRLFDVVIWLPWEQRFRPDIFRISECQTQHQVDPRPIAHAVHAGLKYESESKRKLILAAEAFVARQIVATPPCWSTSDHLNELPLVALCRQVSSRPLQSSAKWCWG